MEIVLHRPEMVVSRLWPMEEVRIMPLGDMHFGAKGCNVDLLKETIRKGQELGCYYIGMGDALDVASGSNRRALWSIQSDLYDSVRQMMDDSVEVQRKSLAHILEPTQGRWLGWLRGNHTWEFGDGTSTESRMANFLDCPFLGDCGMVVLRMEQGKLTCDATIWAHHGVGAGRALTAPLNRLLEMAREFFANVYLIGHHHKNPVTALPWARVRVNKAGKMHWEGCDRYLVATGGFLKGYEIGTRDPMGQPAGGYIEKAMLSPTALGAPIISLRPEIRHGYVSVKTSVLVGGI